MPNRIARDKARPVSRQSRINCMNDTGNPAAAALAPFTLTGKVALITGAASGLGKVTAALLLDVGASVVVAALDAGGAKATAAELGGKGPTLGVGMDVADEAAVQAGFVAAAEAFGGGDGLVNNAAYRGQAEDRTGGV